MATSPINGIPAARGTASIGKLAGVTATAPMTGSQSSPATEDAVSVDVFPAAPPPEVLAAIGTASQAAEDLSSRGLDVRFGTDEQGRLQIGLHDERADTTSPLTPSDVLALAEGQPPQPDN